MEIDELADSLCFKEDVERFVENRGFAKTMKTLLSSKLERAKNVRAGGVGDVRETAIRLVRTHDRNLILRILTIRPGESSLKSTHFLYANHLDLFFVGEGVCEARVFEADEVENRELYDPDRKLGFTNQVFRNGDYLNLRRGIHGFQVTRCEDMAIIERSSSEHDSLVWHFNTDTLKFVGVTSGTVVSSRMCLALDCLALISSPIDESLIEDLALNHKHHYVRWKAVETLGAFSSDRVIPILEKLALEDKHEEVRIAAKGTLGDL